jgi:hypothetical protein
MESSKMSVIIVVLGFCTYLALSYVFSKPRINTKQSAVFIFWRIAAGVCFLGFGVSIVLALYDVKNSSRAIPVLLILLFILGNTEFIWIRKRHAKHDSKNNETK